MKLCPNCRTANDDDAKFCKECATPFTANAAGYAAAQEAVKEKAPLDDLIGRISGRFKKTSVASESQPSLWQKTKGWVRSNYYVMFFIVMIVLVFVVLIIGVNNSKKDLSTIPASTTASVSSLVSSEVIPEVVKVSESDITEIDYTYYLSHADKMVGGYHYRVSGIIEELYLGNKMIVLKDADGKELRASMQKGCDLSSLSEKEYVTLVGVYVTGSDNWVHFSESYTEESGEAAEQTYNRLKAAGDKQRAADKKAEQEKAKKEKKDYIASCKTYKYKDIARNPDKYEGKKAKFKGKVVQVLEGDYYTVLRVNVTKGKYGIYSDTVYVIYTPKSAKESRILEDDIVTLYGELAGIETYETVMGASVSIPKMYAKYITINSK